MMWSPCTKQPGSRSRARAGEGPTFIEGKTYRYRGHYEGDPMVYRSEEELNVAGRGSDCHLPAAVAAA